MAEPKSFPLSDAQKRSVNILFTNAEAAKEKAQAYFQGCVDALPIDLNAFTVRLSEDGTTMMAIPNPPKDDPAPSKPELVK